MLTREVEGRERQAQQARLKAARLPLRKTLEAFECAFQPSIAERQVRELADLAFIKTATTVVVLGPPGVGKTHLALSLAVRALEAGYSVRFTTVAHLAQDLASAPHPNRLRQRLRRYLRPKLLILDEIGYTKLTEDQANHLFALIRDRYEQGATILTSNTSFVSVGNAVGQ